MSPSARLDCKTVQRRSSRHKHLGSRVTPRLMEHARPSLYCYIAFHPLSSRHGSMRHAPSLWTRRRSSRRVSRRASWAGSASSACVMSHRFRLLTETNTPSALSWNVAGIACAPISTPRAAARAGVTPAGAVVGTTRRAKDGGGLDAASRGTPQGWCSLPRTGRKTCRSTVTPAACRASTSGSARRGRWRARQQRQRGQDQQDHVARHERKHLARRETDQQVVVRGEDPARE